MNERHTSADAPAGERAATRSCTRRDYGPIQFATKMREAPSRIQRRRTRGWRTPHDATGRPAVYVGRPTRWGNPHVGPDLTAAEAVAAYQDDLVAGRLPVTLDEVRRNLGGRDLSCWCPLDQPCHADVLLHMANPQLRDHSQTSHLDHQRKDTP